MWLFLSLTTSNQIHKDSWRGEKKKKFKFLTVHKTKDQNIKERLFCLIFYFYRKFKCFIGGEGAQSVQMCFCFVERGHCIEGRRSLQQNIWKNVCVCYTYIDSHSYPLTGKEKMRKSEWETEKLSGKFRHRLSLSLTQIDLQK